MRAAVSLRACHRIRRSRRPSSRRRIRTIVWDRSGRRPPRCPAASSTPPWARRSTRCLRSRSRRSRPPRPPGPGTRPPSAVRASAKPAVGWVARRFGCPLTVDDVIACIGTKEVVASLPRMLSLRDPSRDTVLYPAVAYPTYEMGALLAGLRGCRSRSTTTGTSTSTASIPPTPTARCCCGSTTRATRPAQWQLPRAWSMPSSGRGRAGSSSPATSATPSSPTTPTACPRRRSPPSTLGPTACSSSTRSRSARTWPGCARGSSRGIASWSRIWVRCASTADS